MITIAHCTDFSENAEKALEVMLFNFWSFDIKVDIIHLVEENYEEAITQLEMYKEELINSHREGLGFETYLFDSGQKDALISHLNNEGYMELIVGLEGTGKGAGIGSFLSELYKSYAGSMTIIPLGHEIKIENKVLSAVAYENRQELYALLKFKNFLNFQFSKLIVLIRVKESLSPAEMLEMETMLANILVHSKVELLVLEPKDCNDFLEKEVKKRGLDSYMLYKDDYFDDFAYNLIINKPVNNSFRERLSRINTSKEELLRLKDVGEPLQPLELRSD